MRQLTQTWLVVMLFIFVSLAASAQQTGEKLFNSFCNACHTIGKGKLIGPDLARVGERRSEEWLMKFITSSQTVIKAGDADAVALFRENSQTIMPDAPYSADQIKLILSYITEQSGGSSVSGAPTLPVVETAAGAPARTLESAREPDIRLGKMLFAGQRRLSGNGPACLSCHNVRNDGLPGGGLLAKDLTSVFSRMNDAGIRAIVSNPPFPAMKQAYTGHTISEEEAFYLTAFLKNADERQYDQHPRNYQAYMLGAGMLGLSLLLSLYTWVWRRRKKAIVNERIFNRQIKSESVTY